MSFIAVSRNFGTAISGRWFVAAQRAPKALGKVASKEISLLAAILVVIQILDGIFTGIGVMIYGPGIEANPIIRSLIESWGPANAMLCVKTVAIAIVLFLAYLSNYVNWMPRAMRIVIGIYMVSAIIPWSLILYRHI